MAEEPVQLGECVRVLWVRPPPTRSIGPLSDSVGNTRNKLHICSAEVMNNSWREKQL